MKKSFLYFMVLSSTSSAFNFEPPVVSLSFLNKPPSTVFYGDNLRIPIQMDYINLRMHKYWTFPSGTTLELVNGQCPFFANDEDTYPLGFCVLNLIIPGSRMGKITAGHVSFNVNGRERVGSEDHSWNYTFNTPNFSVTVIPHLLSMLQIHDQEATVGQEFNFNCKSAVEYFDQNTDAGKRPEGIITPLEQNGLHFDQGSFSIIGTPESSGIYNFQVGAKNANGTATPTTITIKVADSLKDKPHFKQQYSLPSVGPLQKYIVNLLDLIEPQPLSNQISFRMDSSQNNPSWLLMSTDDATRLEGDSPRHLECQDIEISIIATSNTGGDSEPITIHIPIALDPSLRPFMEYFKIIKYAGTTFSKDLSEFVSDKAQDGSLRILIDKIEPSAPWLKISSEHPTIIEGVIPADAADKIYQMTIRANTLTGGSSIPIMAQFMVKGSE